MNMASKSKDNHNATINKSIDSTNDDTTVDATFVCSDQSCNKPKQRKGSRGIDCGGHGCLRTFHVSCVGLKHLSDKDLADKFFLCSKCKAFLDFGDELASKDVGLKLEQFRESILEEVNTQLEVIRNSIYIKVGTTTNLIKLLNRTQDGMQLKLTAVEAEIKLLKSRADNLPQKVDTNKGRSLQHNVVFAEQQANLITYAVRAEKAREDRMLNIRVRGFPEPVPSNIDDDKRAFVNMRSTSLSIDIKDSIQVKRVGKVIGTRPRILVVTLENANQRRSVLKNACRLKDAPGFNLIYIDRDYTRAEETEQFALRKRCRELNANMEEDNNDKYIVYANRVCKKSELQSRTS
jgi:hypothetical protein